MEERPEQDCGGYQHQAEDLVAAVGAGLFGPPRFLGDLLKVGLDAGLNHRLDLCSASASIGEHRVKLLNPRVVCYVQ